MAAEFLVGLCSPALAMIAGTSGKFICFCNPTEIGGLAGAGPVGASDTEFGIATVSSHLSIPPVFGMQTILNHALHAVIYRMYRLMTVAWKESSA